MLVYLSYWKVAFMYILSVVKNLEPQVAAHDQEVVGRVLIYYTEIGTSF